MQNAKKEFHQNNHKASNQLNKAFTNHEVRQVFHDMANFVRSESVVRDAVNFCTDSDVIEVSSDRATGPLHT